MSLARADVLAKSRRWSRRAGLGECCRAAEGLRRLRFDADLTWPFIQALNVSSTPPSDRGLDHA